MLIDFVVVVSHWYYYWDFGARDFLLGTRTGIGLVYASATEPFACTNSKAGSRRPDKQTHKQTDRQTDAGTRTLQFRGYSSLSLYLYRSLVVAGYCICLAAPADHHLWILFGRQASEDGWKRARERDDWQIALGGG